MAVAMGQTRTAIIRAQSIPCRPHSRRPHGRRPGARPATRRPHSRRATLPAAAHEARPRQEAG
jgi:hypothetical protein